MFGIVQRDIPRILEAFLSSLQAVEDYRAEVKGMFNEPDPTQCVDESEQAREEREKMKAEVERAGEVLGYAEDGKLHPLPRSFGCLCLILVQV
jgi:nucleoporin NDC1